VVDPLDAFAFSTMALLFPFAFARELFALLPLGWPHSCIAITTVIRTVASKGILIMTSSPLARVAHHQLFLCPLEYTCRC